MAILSSKFFIVKAFGKFCYSFEHITYFKKISLFREIFSYNCILSLNNKSILFFIPLYSSLFKNGSSANMLFATSCAAFNIFISVIKFATLNSGIPCCLVPKNSPWSSKF